MVADSSNLTYSVVNWVKFAQATSPARKFHFQVAVVGADFGKSKEKMMGLWSEIFWFVRTLRLLILSAVLMSAMV